MRFNQPAYRIIHFSDKNWVKCLACSNPGQITTSLEKYSIPYPNATESRSSFICSNCHLQKIESLDWMGMGKGLIANLPHWMLSAKHRDLILKKLGKLEKELRKGFGK